MKKTVVQGRYRLEQKLGEGGMGCVFLAWDLRIGKYWAVKMLKKLTDQQYLEAKIMKDFDHPGLPRIVDVVEEEEKIFLVMDYIKGITLKRYLELKGPVGEKQMLAWAWEICSILEYLHSRKPPVFYLDMKPSNLMITPKGSVKLIDFGVSVFQGIHTSGMGTQQYAPPEQKNKQEADQRTDIYSLGVTLRACLGKQCSTGTRLLIQYCTKEKPDQRCPSAAHLKRWIRRLQRLQLWKKKIPLAILLSLFIVPLPGISQNQNKTSVSRKNEYDILLKKVRKQAVEPVWSQKTADQLEQVIQMDEKRKNAFDELYDYYRRTGKEEQGVAVLVDYVESGAKGARGNDRLLFQIALFYLRGNRGWQYEGKDYALAYRYFSMIGAPSGQEKQYLLLTKELSKESDQTDWGYIWKQLNELSKQEQNLDLKLAFFELYLGNTDYLKKYGNSLKQAEMQLQFIDENKGKYPKEKEYWDTVIAEKSVDLYGQTAKKNHYRTYFQALDQYSAMIPLEQEKVEILLKKGEFFASFGQWEKAEEEYLILKKKYPGNWQILAAYGLLLAQTGKEKEAARYYEKARALGAENNFNMQQLKERLQL